ncbi:MAG: septum formation initiator family protein [Hyphomicrobiaceae bacterium]|nr:MAG: septum formation initiator family protein [Hyphomicrobiaceae bacterium]
MLATETGTNVRPIALRARSGIAYLSPVSMGRVHRLKPYPDRQVSAPRQAMVLLLCLGLSGYFVHQAIKGRHGLELRQALQARVDRLELDLRRLEARRLSAERALKHLGDTIDPDMLDEEARRELGFAHPDELIVVFETAEHRSPRQ